MKPWLRLSLITLTVGGGFSGIAATLQAISRLRNPSPASELIMMVVLGLYAFIIAAGLLLVQRPHQLNLLLIALALQVPWISSPLLTYRFTAGFHITIGLIGSRPAGGFNLGSDFQFYVLQKFPWGIGVNLFALALFLIVAVGRRKGVPPLTLC